MKLDSTLKQAESWINPPFPGLNRSIPIGALCGFLGPIGVGVYLRSVFDFALSAVVAGLAMALLGDDAMMGLLPCVVCSLWVVGRIMWDTKRWREGQGGDDSGNAGAGVAASSGSPSPSASFDSTPPRQPGAAPPHRAPPARAWRDDQDMRLVDDDPAMPQAFPDATPERTAARPRARLA